jgi:hypothetical protein
MTSISLNIMECLCTPTELLHKKYNPDLLLNVFKSLPLKDNIAEINVEFKDTIYVPYIGNKKYIRYKKKSGNDLQYKNKKNNSIINVKLNYLEADIVNYNFHHSVDNIHIFERYLFDFLDKVTFCLNKLKETKKLINISDHELNKHFSNKLQFNITNFSKVKSQINLNQIVKISGVDNIKFIYTIIERMLVSYNTYITEMFTICKDKSLQTNAFKQTLYNFINSDKDKINTIIVIHNENKIKVYCPYIRFISYTTIKDGKNAGKYSRCRYITIQKQSNTKNKWLYLFEHDEESTDDIFDPIKDKDELEKISALDSAITKDIINNIQ